MTDTGLMACARQVIDLEHTRKIDERPRDRGYRDPAPGSRVLGVEARAARHETADTQVGGRRDLRCRCSGLQQTEEMTGRGPAQHRLFAARQDRRQVTSILAWRAVTNAEYAPMYADQSTGAQPLLDLARCHTGMPQLRTRNETMRAGCYPPEHLLHRAAALWSHYDH